MERKDFIKKMALGGSILFTAPVIFNSCSNGTDDIIEEEENNNSNTLSINLEDAAYADLKTVGGYEYKNNIIIIRASETQYIALSSICTHQQNTVVYDKDNNQIVCNYHGSVFNTTGAVVTGPATASLKKYTVSVSGSTLTIK